MSSNSGFQQNYKQTVIDFFDSRTHYDNEHTLQRALPLLKLITLNPGQQILDVATGTGIIAIAAAQTVGPTGKVTGIDFSAGMLHQAQQKITKLGLQNVDLIEADAEHIKFADESFDIIFCSSSLVYFTDIPSTLKNWYHWLRPGGYAAFSGWSETSCDWPLLSKICAQQGIALPNINAPTGTPEKCQTLMKTADFQAIKVKSQQFGTYRSLEKASTWNGLWFHPRENPIAQITLEQLLPLIEAYRQEITAQATEQGIWYESLAHFVIGQKQT